jgi:hypothetical protein
MAFISALTTSMIFLLKGHSKNESVTHRERILSASDDAMTPTQRMSSTTIVPLIPITSLDHCLL